MVVGGVEGTVLMDGSLAVEVRYSDFVKSRNHLFVFRSALKRIHQQSLATIMKV